MYQILFVGSNPADTAKLHLDEEAGEIKAQLAETAYGRMFALQQYLSSVQDTLQDLLMNQAPLIVHWAGHAVDSDPRDPKVARGGERDHSGKSLVMADDDGHSTPAAIAGIAAFFKDRRDSTRCVVLNACNSEAQAQAIAEHVDFVVGTTASIFDKGALAFSGRFYGALGRGKTFREAFVEGQKALEAFPERGSPQMYRCWETADPARRDFSPGIEADRRHKEVTDCVNQLRSLYDEEKGKLKNLERTKALHDALHRLDLTSRTVAMTLPPQTASAQAWSAYKQSMTLLLMQLQAARKLVTAVNGIPVAPELLDGINGQLGKAQGFLKQAQADFNLAGTLASIDSVNNATDAVSSVQLIELPFVNTALVEQSRELRLNKAIDLLDAIQSSLAFLHEREDLRTDAVKAAGKIRAIWDPVKALVDQHNGLQRLVGSLNGILGAPQLFKIRWPTLQPTLGTITDDSTQDNRQQVIAAINRSFPGQSDEFKESLRQLTENLSIAFVNVDDQLLQMCRDLIDVGNELGILVARYA